MPRLAPSNPGVAPRFQVGSHCRRVADPTARSANSEYQELRMAYGNYLASVADDQICQLRARLVGLVGLGEDGGGGRKRTRLIGLCRQIWSGRLDGLTGNAHCHQTLLG